jgi:hypothetical protein
MSLFFLHPLYLFGLAAASLPVLIHLLNRRRLKRVRFPAVKFILLSQKRISRSYRLRHWLLLALRTLAVVFLALLLANPIFQTGAGLFAGGGPVALVVLLDNSLSMKWSGDGDGFKQAKEAARLLISNLNAGDRAALITTDISGKEALRLKRKSGAAERTGANRTRRRQRQLLRGPDQSLRAAQYTRRPKGDSFDHRPGPHRLGSILDIFIEAI